MLEQTVLIALVTVCLSRLIVTERGPYAVFECLRRKVQQLPSWAIELKYLFACPVCLSVWVSLILVILMGQSLVVWPASCALAWLIGNLGGWIKIE